MCDHKYLPVTHKACVPYYIPLSVTDTMKNKYYGNCKTYTTPKII